MSTLCFEYFTYSIFFNSYNNFMSRYYYYYSHFTEEEANIEID